MGKQQQHCLKKAELPLVIAGPMLRKTTANRMVYWLVTSQPVEIELVVEATPAYNNKGSIKNNSIEGMSIESPKIAINYYQVGEKAFIYLIDASFSQPLPPSIFVDILLTPTGNNKQQSITKLLPHLCYGDKPKLMVEIRPDIDHIFHGSCRKPHHCSNDALVALDKSIEINHQQSAENELTRPSLLMMSGDQVYVDDVSAPLLQAIQQTIDLLGLYTEKLPEECEFKADELAQNPNNFYRRANILPTIKTRKDSLISKLYFNKLPIFTSDSANQHLITLAEIIAMYLLTWSQQLWQQVQFDESVIPQQFKEKFAKERNAITTFYQGLNKVERVLAQIPTYMIFDDHDVTDDWNLTRGWEEAAYGNAFSKRILGNALIGYFLGQAWGNEPDDFDESFHQQIAECFEALKQLGSSSVTKVCSAHDKFIDTLLNWEKWHYTIATTPNVVVLDTRTHRWRSESNRNKPSGLMDWEMLTELQQTLMNQPAVILISPAPIFGVKFIEVIQRIFTFFGKALMVDAENWMAHPGSASVILNIFLHKRTPQRFTILSGDVHYSFAFDVSIRRRNQSPEIFQITASGIKNNFPSKLLNVMNVLDRLLYGSLSPLNVFTKRRRMKVKSRRVDGKRGRRLVNESGIGRLSLDKNGAPKAVELLTSEGDRRDFQQVKKS